ncbi:reverse transcriptase-like protein [bacterium]|nr:reverse transcriptase-like protein [bacterium]
MPQKLFEDLLRGKGQQLAAALTAAGVETTLKEDSFRDYTVKLSVRHERRSGGFINLYYAPSRKEFSCKTHQITQAALIPPIESVWTTLSGQPAAAAKPAPIATSGYQLYVDGSYVNGRVGYGAVLLNEGVEMQRFSGRVYDDLQSRQVSGELMATMTALTWCAHHNITPVEVLYDYEGIEKWARGLWKANLPLTQRYVAYMRACPVKVKWHKVRSHTGVEWNEIADQLAKQGAMTPP